MCSWPMTSSNCCGLHLRAMTWYWGIGSLFVICYQLLVIRASVLGSVRQPVQPRMNNQQPITKFSGARLTTAEKGQATVAVFRPWRDSPALLPWDPAPPALYKTVTDRQPSFPLHAYNSSIVMRRTRCVSRQSLLLAPPALYESSTASSVN